MQFFANEMQVIKDETLSMEFSILNDMLALEPDLVPELQPQLQPQDATNNSNNNNASPPPTADNPPPVAVAAAAVDVAPAVESPQP